MFDRPSLSATTVCYPLSVSPQYTLERALQGISGAGLRFVEIVAIPGYCEHLRLEQMGEKEIETLKEQLEKYGLTAIAINVSADLTTEDGVVYLNHAMRVANAMGVKTVVANVMQADSAEKADCFRGFVPRIVSDAERYDAVVAFEIHGGLVNSGMEGVELLKELSSERLKITYDMANVVSYAGILPEADLARMGSEIGRYVAHVHLKDKANMTKDYNFPPFGNGILDFGKVLELLDSGGYQGPMTLEVELDGKPESAEVVDAALAQSREYLNQFWV